MQHTKESIGVILPQYTGNFLFDLLSHAAFSNAILMLQPNAIPIREECPPGSCVCERETLLNDQAGDLRVLRLTKWEEKKLIAHIESISTYAGLQKLQQRLHEQLGVVLHIEPSIHEVRTVRGIIIRLEERPGLCKKIRQSVPAAIRKCLEQNPEIAYAILNARDLLGNS